MQHQTLTRARLVAITLGSIAVASVAAPAVGTDNAPPSGACTDGQGVTVVVDFTDLGGDVEIACATDASTGTAALTSAGFTDTRDASGLICAIDSLPDPCPTEFTGSYWSYWYAEDGAWQAWMEGSDTAVPVAGAVDGWRYSDGTAVPGVDPAELLTEDASEAEDGGPTEDASEADSDLVPVAVMPEVSETSPWTIVLIGAAILAALVVAARLVTRRSGHGPDGQD